MPERLQKWLAAQGQGSRREIERWISAGRVSVNGQPAELGQQVSGRERIEVDGRLIKASTDTTPRVLAYHKPSGEICTRRDPEGRPSVFERLPSLQGQRWISVGRLDVNTAGLLLFTTDGELANALMHPSSGLQREYAVRVHGHLSESDLERLRTGVELEDGPARCLSIMHNGGDSANQWYRIVLDEGRNRVVRRMVEAVGGQVSRLLRVRYGPVHLERDLPRGRWRELHGADRADVYRAAMLAPPDQPRRRRARIAKSGNRKFRR